MDRFVIREKRPRLETTDVMSSTPVSPPPSSSRPTVSVTSAAETFNTNGTNPTNDDSEPVSVSVMNPAKCDLGFIDVKQLSDAERYQLLVTDESVPIIPTPGARRHFLSCWLTDLRFAKWLVYTQKNGGGGLCKLCTIMSPHLKHGPAENQAFTGQPFQNFKKFIEKACTHLSSKAHNQASDAANVFCKSVEQQTSVRTQLSSFHAQQMQTNRDIITGIVKSVLFCASNNLPLRGHESDEGVLNELIRFRVEAGDAELGKHMDTLAKNAKYTSPTLQNEIIHIAAGELISQIVKEANNSQYISLIADESADISGLEQLSVVLRYMKDSAILESFVGFVELENVDAKSISEVILKYLDKIGIDRTMIIGQGYDGASTMSGHISGVQKRIRDELPKALFVHCSAHCLNLVINDQSSVTPIRNACDIIRETITFFRSSPKRQTLLGIKIPLFCATRWTSKYQSIRLFAKHYEAILTALETLTTEANRETRTKALSHKAALENSTFIYTMCLISKYSALMEPLSAQLQSTKLHIDSVTKLINSLMDILQHDRLDCDDKNVSIYQEACTKLGEDELPVPRVVKRQVHRENTPSQTPQDYFKRTIFIPYLDGLLSSLNERFIENRDGLDILSIIPPNTPTEQVANKITTLYDLGNLAAELRLWQHGMDPCQTFTVEELLDSTSVFPDVHAAVRIAYTLPASTAEAERTFSALRRIKTWLRSTMTSNRLSDLAVIHVHRHKMTHTLTEHVVTLLSNENRRLQWQ